MRIIAVDLVSVRHGRLGRARQRTPTVPDRDVSIMVKISARNAGGDTISGLGEIRASRSQTGESQDEAFGFASRLAGAVFGTNLDASARGRAAAQAAEAFVAQHVKALCGVSPDRRLPRGVHPAVRFGFDCAILDLMARHEDLSVSSLLGCERKGVRLNVSSSDFAQPIALLDALCQPSRQPVWLRSRFSGIGSATRDVFATVATARADGHGVNTGLWFALGGAWSAADFAAMVSELRRFAPDGIDVMLEQPFPAIADAHFGSAFATIEAGALPVRVMVEDGLANGATLGEAGIDAYLPTCDLRVTPQTFGSVNAILDRIASAHEAGFDGRVYLGNFGRNTGFNTVVLTMLAQWLPGVSYFSARPVVGRTFRQVHPQAEVSVVDEPSGTFEVLTSPPGQGWGVDLCRSILKSRLIRAEFFREQQVTSFDHQMLVEELILDSLDDATLSVGVLDEEDDGVEA